MATQQELCLSVTHGGCERFLHARDRRAAALAQDHIEFGRLESARFGPFSSPIPIAVDARPPGADHPGRSASGRRRVPGLLIGAGVILVGIVTLAVIFGGERSPGVALLSPSPVLSPAVRTPTTTPPMRPDDTGGAAAIAPTVRPTAVATAKPGPTATATSAPAAKPVAPTPRTAATARPEPTQKVNPTPGPAIARRYTVKKGDTIKSIASKFGLRPRDLRAVNDIGKDVVVGERLLIPARSISAP